MARKSRVLTDHDEIRRWAEERDAQPACVRGTGSEEDVGMIRLDFPGYSGETSLEPIEWDEWLQKFEDNKLALVVEDDTAGGEQSTFNKIIGRETSAAQTPGRKTSRRSERGAGRKESSRSRSASSARASSRRASRSGSRRATSSRSSRSRSGRSTSARGNSRGSSRSSGKVTGKKRAQNARSSSRSRSRRRAA